MLTEEPRDNDAFVVGDSRLIEGSEDCVTVVSELTLNLGERETLTEDVTEFVARGLVERRAERVALDEAAADLDADVELEGMRLTDDEKEEALDAVNMAENDSNCDVTAELDGDDDRLVDEDSESSRVLLALTEGE